MENWIKISEQLPMHYDTVLVWVEAQNYKSVHLAYVDKNKEFKVMDESGNHSKFITHWQHLPEGPK